jgi:hypothetical protein
MSNKHSKCLNKDINSISDHQNWFGTDENLGPLAISIRREKVPVHPNAAEVFLTPRNLDPDKDFREQVKQDQGSISRKDGDERNSCRPTASHLFQVMKKELNFFVELCGP